MTDQISAPSAPEPDSPQSSGVLNNILNDTTDDIFIFDADDDDDNNTNEETVIRQHAQHVIPQAEVLTPPRPTTSTTNATTLSPTVVGTPPPPIPMISVQDKDDDAASVVSTLATPTKYSVTNPIVEAALRSQQQHQKREDSATASSVPVDRQEAYKQAILLALRKRQELEDNASPRTVDEDVVTTKEATDTADSKKTQHPKQASSDNGASGSGTGGISEATISKLALPTLEAATKPNVLPSQPNPYATGINTNNSSSSDDDESDGMRSGSFPVTTTTTATATTTTNSSATNVSILVDTTTGHPISISKEEESGGGNGSIMIDNETTAYRSSSTSTTTSLPPEKEVKSKKDEKEEGILRQSVVDQRRSHHRIQMVDHSGRINDVSVNDDDAPQVVDDADDDYDVIPLVREPAVNSKESVQRNQNRVDKDPSTTPSNKLLGEKDYGRDDDNTDNDVEEEDRRKKLMMKNLFIFGMIGIVIVIAGAIIAGIFIMREQRNVDVDDDGENDIGDDDPENVAPTTVPTSWTPPSSNNNNESTDAPTLVDKLSPSWAPSNSNTETTDAPTMVDKISLMVSSILLRDITDPFTLLNEPESSQYQALNWLVYDDPWFQLTFDKLANIDGIIYESFEDRYSRNSSSNNNTEPDAFTLTMDVLAERYSLAVLYFETNGPGWFINGDWLSGNGACLWYGVSCLDETERIIIANDENGDNQTLLFRFATALDFHDDFEPIRNGNGLHGSIPPEIGFLSRLQVLDLSGQIGCSTSLEEEVEDCSPLRENPKVVSGDIPTEIGFLSQLMSLNIRNQHLNATIPSQAIQTLTRLSTFDMSQNLLSGTIPAQIGSLTSLSHLHLHNNVLSGAIPSEIGMLPHLNDLTLNNNELSGRKPSDAAGGMSSLTELSLQHNKLTGPIPVNISDIQTLNTLNLSFNDLSSTIPSEIGRLSELVYLNLQNNTLTGTVPRLIKGLYRLFEFNIENNQLEGNINSIFCEQATNFTRLKRGQFPTLYNLCVGHVGRGSEGGGGVDCSTTTNTTVTTDEDVTCNPNTTKTATAIQCNCCLCR